MSDSRDSCDSFLDTIFHTPRGSPESTGQPSSPVSINCPTCKTIVDILNEMKVYIERKAVLHDVVEVFPRKKRYFFTLKRAIRRTRLFEYDPCVCKHHAKFHPATGKCSGLVVALSWAYHTSNTMEIDVCHDDIVLTMEANYANWKTFWYEKKDSLSRVRAMSKMARYDSVLDFNRQMYSIDN